jgi:DNA-binding XRE family transcriptional regulator
VANELGVTAETIHQHRSHILKKLLLKRLGPALGTEKTKPTARRQGRADVVVPSAFSAAQLRAARALLDWSLLDAAAALEVSHVTLTHIETDKLRRVQRWEIPSKYVRKYEP